jgi:hypothetical protein
MRSKAVVALGRIVLAKRERVMAIEPYDKGFIGTTLRYSYEVGKERPNGMSASGAARLRVAANYYRDHRRHGIDRAHRNRTRIRTAPFLDGARAAPVPAARAANLASA